jgi:hypothetical protein
MMNVEMKPGDFNRLFADLPKIAKTANARTLDIVARKVNKNLKAHVAKKYNVPKGAMTLRGGLISIQRANARTNKGNATIFIKRKGRGLIKYGAKKIGTGISVKVTKAPKTIKGGFISVLKRGSSNKFAFAKARGKKAGIITRRTKRGKAYPAAKREILYGPPISDLYTNASAGRVIFDTIDEEFQKELDKQFSILFDK